MITLREAAQQALEALESLFTLQADDARPKRCGDAITALRAALEQPEPVNYFEVQRIANECGLDYNKFAAALRDYAAMKE